MNNDRARPNLINIDEITFDCMYADVAEYMNIQTSRHEELQANYKKCIDDQHQIKKQLADITQALYYIGLRLNVSEITGDQ